MADSPSRVGYQYVTLRYVPRVAREEFLNVGVVLFAQSADFLAAAYHLDAARLRAFDPGVDLDAVDSMLSTVQSVCRGETGRGMPHLTSPGRRFGWLAAPRSTSIQPGPRHGGLCLDPETELARLLDELVR